VLLEQLLEVLAGVVAALIRVMQLRGRLAPAPNSHHQRIGDPSDIGLAAARGRRPAIGLPAERAQDILPFQVQQETSMKRSSFIAIGLLAAGFGLSGCANMPGMVGGWVSLIDGNAGLENFDRIGDANWRAEDDAIVADKGAGGFLVTKKTYRDFQIRAEFWADHTTNSGIFLRAANPAKVAAATSSKALRSRGA